MKERVVKFIRAAKPWLIFVAVVVLLRYTGILSAVSSGTQYALMQTGLMDADPSSAVDADKRFTYNFSLMDMNKRTVDMQSMKGKVIFINVWATWCGPCRVEMPSIENLYKSVDHDKVQFVMLSVDQRDPYEKVSKYLSDKGYSFPVYFPDGALPELLQVRSIPATMVINKEGKVVYRKTGTANYDTEEFRSFLQKLY